LNKYEKFVPLVKWNEHHPHPSVGTLYRWLYKKEPKWFLSVVQRIGKSWYIDEEEFFKAVKLHTDLELGR